MNGSTSVSPATSWLTWPLQFTELATQAFRGNPIQAAPDVLAQNINPWTININSNNSSAPGTEQRILARHSYGRQLGRISEVLTVLLDERDPKRSDARFADFRTMTDEIDEVKAGNAVARVERLLADLDLLKVLRPDEHARLHAELERQLRRPGSKR